MSCPVSFMKPVEAHCSATPCQSPVYPPPSGAAASPCSTGLARKMGPACGKIAKRFHEPPPESGDACARAAGVDQCGKPVLELVDILREQSYVMSDAGVVQQVGFRAVDVVPAL